MVRKNFCIILDSNIWIKTFLLKSSIAIAFLYHVVTNKYKIGLPEVIKREIIINIKKRGMQLLDEVTRKLELIGFIQNDAKNLIKNLPQKEDLDNSINERLKELSKLFIDHIHSQSEFEGALNMVINSVPPNSEKNQQYKDSLIWQSILNLCKKYHVIFITEDKGFFEDRDYTKGLDSSLISHIRKNKYHFDIKSDIEKFTSIHKPIKDTLNSAEISGKIFNLAKNEIDKFSIQEGYFLKEKKESKLKYFLTSDKYILVINFIIEYKLGEIHEHEDISNPTLIFDGNCLYIINKNEVSDLVVDKFQLSAQKGITKGLVSFRSKSWPGEDISILGEI